ncbi:structural protein [Pseudomonas phage vB_PaeM_PA5oct]|uniref:Structural protein n=1 Tax=Pseudomonas phage vB_PaeM_PA5oct TaxID=2163605 RepID=A0A4Y5JTQ7_9CAUD|nr:structural protein [Pseudomonas phage vB_PaeM_PA5oct]QCG76086.1 structural protein [Pseudomonas phage vB_PaeM_PA5oct]
MKLFEVFTLYEDKAELIVKNQGPNLLAAAKNYGSNIRTAEEIMNVLKSADPTSNQKYLQWITNRFIAGEFRLEDVYRIKSELTKFDRNKRSLEKKDINQYKTLGSLYDVLDSIGNDTTEPVSNKQAKKHEYKAQRDELISSGQADVLYKGPEGMLVNPKTEDAAKFFGKGTRWCTAADNDNMFDYYNGMGPLYTWLGSDGVKSQFHLETDQWMDERDEPLDDEGMKRLISIPVIKKMYDDGIIKSENNITSGDFDRSYDDRLTDAGYDNWRDKEQKISDHIRKYGMSENLIDKLVSKNPLLPLFVLPTWNKYPATSAMDNYFLKLSKGKQPKDFGEGQGPGFYEGDVLNRLCEYMESTNSWNNTIDEASFNLVRRLLDVDPNSYVLGKFMGESPEDAKIKQYLLSNLPYAAKTIDAGDWPDLLVAVGKQVHNAKTPEEKKQSMELAREVLTHTGSSVAHWFIKLMKETEAGREFEASLNKYK